MRLDIQSDVAGAPILVTLSRRNLLALLAKLSQPGSACAIESANAYVDGQLFPIAFRVHSESDELHYSDRPLPGPMHPATEELLEFWGQANREDDEADPGSEIT